MNSKSYNFCCTKYFLKTRGVLLFFLANSLWFIFHCTKKGEYQNLHFKWFYIRMPFTIINAKKCEGLKKYPFNVCILNLNLSYLSELFLSSPYHPLPHHKNPHYSRPSIQTHKYTYSHNPLFPDTRAQTHTQLNVCNLYLIYIHT